MSLLHSSADEPETSDKADAPVEPLQEDVHKDWVLGCFYLLVAVFVVSCSTVLQVSICGFCEWDSDQSTLHAGCDLNPLKGAGPMCNARSPSGHTPHVGCSDPESHSFLVA